MKLQFSITICLSFFSAGWYVVTKGNSLSAVLCFCGLRWLKTVSSTFQDVDFDGS